MKLYVWCDPYPVHGGGGWVNSASMVFAVANNLREAKMLAKKGPKFEDFSTEMDSDMSEVQLGKPTRVVKLPCAEWHEWCEA
jgi:hypothetical protein